MSITDSMAYGNNGQQFKWGPNDNPMVFTNNIVVGNCFRLSAPMPGVSKSYNANLGDYCRADDTITFSLGNNGNTRIDHNTVVSYAPTVFDIECGPAGCTNSTVTLSNNIVLGYDNPATYPAGGKPGGPGGFYMEHPIGKVVRSNNIYYGLRGLRMQTLFSNEKIADPKFISQPVFSKEQDLDHFNFQLSPGSPAHGIGATPQ